MTTNLIIVDDFYNNPDEVRDHALSMEFSVSGNFPGHRTVSDINDHTKVELRRILLPHAGKVIDWHDNEYSGAFQYTTSLDRSWIHTDQTSTWAGVLYLTPNAPISGGTGLFKHKEFHRSVVHQGSEMIRNQMESDGNDITKWEMTDRVANVYNRLVLYRSNQFHMSLDYFGSDITSGRLFQTFFLTTEF